MNYDLKKFINALPIDLIEHILNFIDVIKVLDVSHNKNNNTLLNKYIDIKYSIFFDKIHLKHNIPLDIANYIVDIYPKKLKIINEIYKKHVKKDIIKNGYYDLFIYLLNDYLNEYGINEFNRISYITFDTKTDLIKYFIIKNNFDKIDFIIKYYKYKPVQVIGNISNNNFKIIDKICNTYNISTEEIEQIFSLNFFKIDNKKLFIYLVENYIKNDFSKLDYEKIIEHIIYNNNFDIILYLINSNKFTDYNYICNTIFKTFYSHSIILLTFLEKYHDKVDKNILYKIFICIKNKIIDKKYCPSYKYKTSIVLITSFIDTKETIYKIFKFLYNNYSNNDEFNIKDNYYYNNLFRYFFHSLIYYYEINNNVSLMDKNKILEIFIQKIKDLEELNIFLSNDNFRYIKDLFIDDIAKDEYISVYKNEYEKIFYEVRLLMIDYLYFKYTEYFTDSNIFLIDMIYYKKYYIIAKLVKNGINLNNEFYKYILSQKNSEEIIVNLYNEGINFIDIGQDIIFCKYFASKNNYNKLKYLCMNGFNINEDVMNVAIYNLSYDIVNYLFFEKNIKINNTGTEILNIYSESNISTQSLFSNQIFKLCFCQ